MLKSVRLENYRAYKDTGEIKLNKLNIFLGANNAGKTSFASAIEVFARSAVGRGQKSPLVLAEMPSLATFDSVLRKHWSPREARPREFGLTFSFGDDSSIATVAIAFSSSGDDNSPVANRIEYRLPRWSASLKLESVKGSQKYSIRAGRLKGDPQEIMFSGLVPFPMAFGKGVSKTWMELPQRFYSSKIFRDMRQLEIVNPSRPVPRSVYVLDDPNLGVDDKDLLSYLINVFSSSEKADVKVRDLIIRNLDVLGLATDFDVTTISKKTSSKIVALRVSPSNKRQKVTIADVGFGLSQVLPLVVKDARLKNGVLIAYQPEVHLHPRAQSRLADIFVKSVARGNQVFIETHSPDLILRLQRLVVDGQIDANDVSVFCFENSGGSSNISIVDFTKSGAPSIKWPAGFLDTSLTLARDLANSRTSIGEIGKS